MKKEDLNIDLVNDEKIASKDDYEITWVDKINLFISHTIKYLIPGIVLVMMYEVFVRYVLFAPTLWANELSLWLAGIVYLIGGIYAMRVRSHIRIVMLYDIVSRKTQRIFDLIAVIVLVLYVIALVYGGIPDASRAFLKWERFGTAWDPPIPAVLKPLILLSMILITLQAINNLIIDWKKPKEIAYDPTKDLK